MKKLWVAGVALLALGAPAMGQGAGPGTANSSAPPWLGSYIGGNLGYGWGRTTAPLVEVAGCCFFPLTGQFGPGFFPANISARQSGLIGGGQIGYNYKIETLLVGIESDFQYAHVNGSSGTVTGSVLQGFPLRPVPIYYKQDQTLEWLGTTRGRLGFVAGDKALIYGTGGVAYGRTVAVGNLLYPFSGGSYTENGGAAATKAGWAAGGGIEAALGENWKFKVEYLYYDLGTLTLPMTSPNVCCISETLRATLPVRGNIVRVGLNYGFR